MLGHLNPGPEQFGLPALPKEVPWELGFMSGAPAYI